jgi:L-type amino acid transporter 9
MFFQVPLIIPVLIAIVAIFLAVIPLVLSPDPQFLIAVGFIISGLAVYYPFVYKTKRLKCMGLYFLNFKSYFENFIMFWLK